jgi:hypothetical protein
LDFHSLPLWNWKRGRAIMDCDPKKRNPLNRNS